MIRRIGKDIDSAQFWRERAAQYSDEIADAYHQHRLSVIEALFPSGGMRNLRCLEFGSGDGVVLARLADLGAEVIGIERSAELLHDSERRLKSARHIQGGVDALEHIEPQSIDLLLSLNVIAYFTDDEERQFYTQTSRVLKRGAHFIATHSNELFDLFTLNAFTADFLARNFSGESNRDRIAALLTNGLPNEQTVTYNVRENPLTYRFKLMKYGLQEAQQEFANLHALPPALLRRDANAGTSYPDTLNRPAEERWKLLFQCSMFGSRAVRL
jgi:2-polyprenyl-3-methyl-5-hydroxy-6-metoxy-1,4-benzoquinol methylase